MTKTILITSLLAVTIIVATATLVFFPSKDTMAALPAGFDSFPSSATVAVEIAGNTESVSLSGKVPTIIERKTPDPSGVIATEIIEMQLTGSSPTLGTVDVRVGQMFGLPASTGQIIPQSPGADFPADSFFDVFFDITVNTPSGPVCLKNQDPLRLGQTIDHIPPTGFPYLAQAGLNIPLFDCTTGAPFGGSLVHAYHLPGTNEDLKVEIKKEIIALSKSQKVSETVELNEYKIKSGEALVLLDTTGSGTLSVVHVAANLPCNSNSGPTAGGGNDTPDVSIVAGVAGGPVGFVIDQTSTAQDTGFIGPEKTCIFHATVSTPFPGFHSVTGAPATVTSITDVILINTGSSEVDLKQVLVTTTGTYS